MLASCVFMPLNVMAVKCVIYREVRRERDVDFLSVRRDPVQEQRVVHGAVPRHLEAVKRPARKKCMR